MIKTITIIGSGNVATRLGLALIANGFAVAGVWSPNEKHASGLAGKLNCKPLPSLEKAARISSDLILLAIPDRYVKEISDKLPGTESIVAHTSGITPMKALEKHRNHGVFYPLQTFSKDHENDLKKVPFCIEASGDKVFEPLKELASALSENVRKVDSVERRILHLAATFVNNFTNYMYLSAAEILENKNIDFDILLPLIDETARKIHRMHPLHAQTGPARRKDLSTLQTHLALLEEHPRLKDLYIKISNLINDKYE